MDMMVDKSLKILKYLVFYENICGKNELLIVDFINFCINCLYGITGVFLSFQVWIERIASLMENHVGDGVKTA